MSSDLFLGSSVHRTKVPYNSTICGGNVNTTLLKTVEEERRTKKEKQKTTATTTITKEEKRLVNGLKQASGQYAYCIETRLMPYSNLYKFSDFSDFSEFSDVFCVPGLYPARHFTVSSHYF